MRRIAVYPLDSIITGYSGFSCLLSIIERMPWERGYKKSWAQAETFQDVLNNSLIIWVSWTSMQVRGLVAVNSS